MTNQSADRVRTSWTKLQPIVIDLLPLALLLLATVIANSWWTMHHRSDMPFDIDESGYLQRTLVDSWQLTHNGVSAFIGQLRGPDPQAPLLPATAAVVRSLTGTGLVGMILVQQLWYSILIVSTWIVARKLAGKFAAVTAAVIVAATPAVFISSRTFHFALVASATVTAALCAQLWAGSFDRVKRALLWGLLIGVAALSRTMVLGLLPGLLLAAVLRIAATGTTTVRLRNLLLGIIAAFLTAWFWYSASWHSVAEYLRSYGYGKMASSYGEKSSIFSTTWWTRRPIHSIQDALWAPTTLLLLLLTVIAIIGMVLRFNSQSATEEVHTVQSSASHRFHQVRRFSTTDWMTIIVFVVWSYFALSSTMNTGSWFELPVLPALIILIVCAACWNRVAAIISLTLALVTSIAVFWGDSGSSFDPPVSWKLGPASSVAFDSRGSLTTYADAFLPDSATATRSQLSDELRAELRTTNQLAELLQNEAQSHGRRPVVFFATQDPFINTNSVGLASFIQTGRQLPVGLLPDEKATGVPLLERLTNPIYGLPNIVVTGPNSVNASAAAFSPMTSPVDSVSALTEAGFSPSKTLSLPDGRVLQIWWRESGPALP